MIEDSHRLAAIDSRIEHLAAEGKRIQENLERALNQRAELMRKTDQPPRNSVIRFQVQFTNGGVVYTYIAYRSPVGDWSITGKKETFSWDEVISFMRRDWGTKTRYDGKVRFFLHDNGSKAGKWQGRKE